MSSVKATKKRGSSARKAEDGAAAAPATKKAKAGGFAGAIGNILGSKKPVLASAGSATSGHKIKGDESDKPSELRKKKAKVTAKKHVLPEMDTNEKVLLKTATRGVVALFNAILKHQKNIADADASTATKKEAVEKGSKSSFLNMLNTTLKAGPSLSTGSLTKGGSGQQPASRSGAGAGGDGFDDDEPKAKGKAALNFLDDQMMLGNDKLKGWDKAQDDLEDSSEGDELAGGMNEEEDDEQEEEEYE
jgi:hypothetical protein